MNIVPPKEIEIEWFKYIQLRDSGLKKQANKALLTVISAIHNSDQEKMKEFLLSLCDECLVSFSEQRIQQPLYVKCILPILVEGLKNGSVPEITYLVRSNACGFSNEVFKEIGDITEEDLLKKALEIDPSNIEAINLLANDYVQALDFGAHHLPESLIVELSYAKRVLSESAEFILRNRDCINESILQGHKYYSFLYSDYETWESEKKEITFSEWCSLNKREYSWVTTVNYEK